MIARNDTTIRIIFFDFFMILPRLIITFIKLLPYK
nr:MAG TPA: hypothetical protein [Caudoviricetes sp.]